jgi:hypothetical protein
MERNKIWDLFDFSTDKSNIGVKWVYKRKLSEKEKMEQHKARLVAKGLSQQPSINYVETFSLVVRLDIVRTILFTAN